MKVQYPVCFVCTYYKFLKKSTAKAANTLAVLDIILPSGADSVITRLAYISDI